MKINISIKSVGKRRPVLDKVSYESLGNYSVHMGSGVVHVEAIGMAAILPVHSQARGRIFLPFADDDPKTQEIMSKILLLSEDKKIKDPEILRQLC